MPGLNLDGCGDVLRAGGFEKAGVGSPLRWLSRLREDQIIRLFAHVIISRAMGSSRFTWVRIAA